VIDGASSTSEVGVEDLGEFREGCCVGVVLAAGFARPEQNFKLGSGLLGNFEILSIKRFAAPLAGLVDDDQLVSPTGAGLTAAEYDA